MAVSSAALALLQIAGQFGAARDIFQQEVLPRLWKLVAAIGVLVVGWYVSKLVVRSVGRMIARQFQRPSITQTVLRGIRASVLLVALVIAAQILGFDRGNILLSGVVFSAVVAVILAPIVGSVISGLFVLADQPFEIGDMIELPDNNSGKKGFVEDITLRYTKMFTLDNTFIVVPNSTVRERDVINYSAEDERTRQSISLLVTYESDLEEARRIAERAARNVDEVIGGGPAIRVGNARFAAAPTCFIEEFGDHGVRLTLRYWLKQPYKLLVVKSEINENIWAELDDADVEIAYPHSHLVFDETSGQAQVAVTNRPAGATEEQITDGVDRQPDRTTSGESADVPTDADSEE
jgi:small-conductance mechanosensitive channel